MRISTYSTCSIHLFSSKKKHLGWKSTVQIPKKVNSLKPNNTCEPHDITLYCNFLQLSAGNFQLQKISWKIRAGQFHASTNQFRLVVYPIIYRVWCIQVPLTIPLPSSHQRGSADQRNQPADRGISGPAQEAAPCDKMHGAQETGRKALPKEKWAAVIFAKRFLRYPPLNYQHSSHEARFKGLWCVAWESTCWLSQSDSFLSKNLVNLHVLPYPTSLSFSRRFSVASCWRRASLHCVGLIFCVWFVLFQTFFWDSSGFQSLVCNASFLASIYGALRLPFVFLLFSCLFPFGCQLVGRVMFVTFFYFARAVRCSFLVSFYLLGCFFAIWDADQQILRPFFVACHRWLVRASPMKFDCGKPC